MHYSTDYFHTPEKAHEFSLFFESCAFSSILCVTYETIQHVPTELFLPDSQEKTNYRNCNQRQQRCQHNSISAACLIRTIFFCHQSYDTSHRHGHLQNENSKNHLIHRKYIFQKLRDNDRKNHHTKQSEQINSSC